MRKYPVAALAAAMLPFFLSGPVVSQAASARTPSPCDAGPGTATLCLFSDYNWNGNVESFSKDLGRCNTTHIAPVSLFNWTDRNIIFYTGANCSGAGYRITANNLTGRLLAPVRSFRAE